MRIGSYVAMKLDFLDCSFNPNRHEAGHFYPPQLYETSIFSTTVLHCPRGVMDKAVDSNAKGPWFDPCLCKHFFKDEISFCKLKLLKL